MPRKLAGFVLAVCITTLPGLAQNTTELLQKGIFAQETQGNLDEAILIYRQIVNSAPAQRDLAAQAQYRLAQSLLQKGDLANASKEFERLARDYADYGNLVSGIAMQARRAVVAPPMPGQNLRGGPPDPATLAALSFDPNRPVVIRGTVGAVMFANPLGMILVDPGNGTERFVFLTAAASEMMKQGFTRTTLKPGDEVIITGIVGGKVEEGPAGSVIGAKAETITLPDGTVVFNRAKIQ